MKDLRDVGLKRGANRKLKNLRNVGCKNRQAPPPVRHFLVTYMFLSHSCRSSFYGTIKFLVNSEKQGDLFVLLQYTCFHLWYNFVSFFENLTTLISRIIRKSHTSFQIIAMQQWSTIASQQWSDSQQWSAIASQQWSD